MILKINVGVTLDLAGRHFNIPSLLPLMPYQRAHFLITNLQETIILQGKYYTNFLRDNFAHLQFLNFYF